MIFIYGYNISYGYDLRWRWWGSSFFLRTGTCPYCLTQGRECTQSFPSQKLSRARKTWPFPGSGSFMNFSLCLGCCQVATLIIYALVCPHWVACLVLLRWRKANTGNCKTASSAKTEQESGGAKKVCMLGTSKSKRVWIFTAHVKDLNVTW